MCSLFPLIYLIKFSFFPVCHLNIQVPSHTIQPAKTQTKWPYKKCWKTIYWYTYSSHKMNRRWARYSSYSLCALCFTPVKLPHFFFHTTCFTPFLFYSSLAWEQFFFSNALWPKKKICSSTQNTSSFRSVSHELIITPIS